MMNSPLLDKSLKFAARIIKLYQFLVKEKKESVISKQILRSGTSIGANANEAAYGVSKADFISKMQISLRACVHREDVRIFEHNFAECKAKNRRNT